MVPFVELLNAHIQAKYVTSVIKEVVIVDYIPDCNYIVYTSQGEFMEVKVKL